MHHEQEIVELCLKQFNTNLAGVIVFGSYNSGPYVEGVSDIDVNVYLKKREGLNLEHERLFLVESAKHLKLSVQNLQTLDGCFDRIYHEGSWTSWITLICGSRTLYFASEFLEFIKKITNTQISQENLSAYLKNKDALELYGYLPKLSGWELTKGLYAHIRRKLQVLVHKKTNMLIFDYLACLAALELHSKSKNLLENLAKYYEKRMPLTSEEAQPYFETASMLSKMILY